MNFDGGFSKVYNEQGVEKFYNQQGANYSNPHRYDIERLLRKKLSKKNPWINENSKILDLACGSGEITGPLLTYGYKNIQGTDPYTHESYKAHTKRQCDRFSFMDILNDSYGQQKFDCIICSYALHLVKESMLNSFCNKLAQISRFLIVIAPHKLPVIKEGYGWVQVQSSNLDKIHFRVFRSQAFEEEETEQKQEKGEDKKQQQEK